MGTCDGKGCGIEIRRGDEFVTPLSGHLVCRPCWEKGDEWLDAIPRDASDAYLDEIAKDLPEEPADYGPDNPYF